MKKIIYLVFILTLGCGYPKYATKPNFDTSIVKDFGALPDTTSMTEQVHYYMKVQLLDYDSAKFLHPTVYRGWNKEKTLTGGYIYSVMINCKNQYGGYSGYRVNHFFFRDNEYWYRLYDFDRNDKWGYAYE